MGLYLPIARPILDHASWDQGLHLPESDQYEHSLEQPQGLISLLCWFDVNPKLRSRIEFS